MRFSDIYPLNLKFNMSRQIAVFQDPKHPELMRALDLFQSDDKKATEDLLNLFDETERQVQANKQNKSNQHQHIKPRVPFKTPQ